MPDTPGTTAVAEALSNAVRAEFKLKQQLDAVREYVETSDDDGIRTRETVLRIVGASTGRDR